jgi:hypothetical protein
MREELARMWNLACLVFYKVVGDWEVNDSAGNLPHGVRLKIEDGVGPMVVPRTKYDDQWSRL